METVLTAAATVLMWVVGWKELLVVMMVIGLPLLVIVLLLFATHTDKDGKVFLNLRFGNEGNTGAAAQDEQILREMNDGLQRMEQRIDALETLLGDEKAKGERK
ncbi:MAG TPA: hypothetical protein PLY17_08515 [Candidatus Hydrogenedentes bacterium]|nr:hypothetical protein [Candidatus Hydrogenedentota bacterium]